MNKPIIATAIKNIFIEGSAWDKAHKLWYEERAKELKDDSIKKWIGRDDYFKGVDEVMLRLYPNLSEEERTKKARELFFDSVVKYIEQNSSVVKQESVEQFKKLKKNYRIALITTNTQGALERILTACNLEDFFDLKETSLPEEKDDVKLVFERFIEKYGKPIIYLGTNEKSLVYAKEKGIKTTSSLKELRNVFS